MEEKKKLKDRTKGKNQKEKLKKSTKEHWKERETDLKRTKKQKLKHKIPRDPETFPRSVRELVITSNSLSLG